jgi:hypothetical protein
MGVGGQRHAPDALPPAKTRYPLYRRLGGPQSRSERVRKISHPPRFNPRTVQTVASRYTDWAIPAHSITLIPALRPSNHFDSLCFWRRKFGIHFSSLPICVSFLGQAFTSAFIGSMYILTINNSTKPAYPTHWFHRLQDCERFWYKRIMARRVRQVQMATISKYNTCT